MDFEVVRSRMLVFSAVLFAVCGFAIAQNNCECNEYWLCPDEQAQQNSQCAGEYEVLCCKESSGGDTKVPVSPTPKEPQTDGAVVCGVRGKSVQPPVTVPTSPTGSPTSESTPTFTVDYKLDDQTGGDISTSFGEFPWMVAIITRTNGIEKFLCGGSIVSPNIILTTAHSVSDISVSDLRVRAGIWDTQDLNEVGLQQERSVSEVLLHSGYDKLKVTNDVALVVLKDPLDWSTNIAPVCLPRNRQFDSNRCIATGWGTKNFINTNSSADVPNTLKKVDLPLVDYETCQNQFRQSPKLGPSFNLHNSFICAGGNGKDTCRGDGGGPLICSMVDDPGRYVQVGITSWGIGCGNTPGAYASVAAALDWIETMIDNYPAIGYKG